MLTIALCPSLVSTLLALPSPAPAPAADWIVPTGATVVYDTSLGPLLVANLVVEPGGVLVARGPLPFRVEASASIRIDGTLDLSGQDGRTVFTLDLPQVPVHGGRGGPAAGEGGIASWMTTASTPEGDDGAGALGVAGLGGGGGETGYHPSTVSFGALRRGAGGGGGVLGPDRPLVPGDPEAPANLGRVALAGVDGSELATGAVLGGSPPQGGAAGPPIFVDGDARNDFFGRRLAPNGALIVGELSQPTAGQGGGAGGDSVRSDVWPPTSFDPSGNDQGGGGGGGGGLGLLLTRRFEIGAAGAIVADGGAGGSGENTNFVNRIGPGGGGGSGGMIVVQAEEIDLTGAGPDALSALGGAGGAGADNQPRATGGGGNGGPGLIQLHVPDGDPARVQLPAGTSLDELSAPPALVLLVEPGL